MKNLLGAAVFAVACLFAFAASADAPAAVSIWSPGPLYVAAQPYVLAILNIVVLPVLMGWIAWILKAKFNLDLSNSAQAALQQSALNAAGRIMASQDAHVANMKVDIHSPLIANELPKVQASAADAIKHFDLSPERVANLIQGKLGQLQAQAQNVPPAAIVVSPSSVTASVGRPINGNTMGVK